MPYTLTDAIKDEIKTLEDMSAWESDFGGGKLWPMIFTSLAESLDRISQRMEGKDWRVTADPKEPSKYYLKGIKTNRKTLEEEYPALRTAAERYDLIKTLVDSTTDE
jgi:hypothetical protein